MITRIYVGVTGDTEFRNSCWGGMGTDDRECISQRKRQGMSAGSRVTTGRDDNFQRDIIYRWDATVSYSGTAGRDGTVVARLIAQ